MKFPPWHDMAPRAKSHDILADHWQMQPIMERFTDVDGFFRIFLFQKEARTAEATGRIMESTRLDEYLVLWEVNIVQS